MSKKPDSQPKTVESALDQVFPAMSQAVNKWMADNTEEMIRERVFDQLNNASAQIVKKLLGFKQDSWNHNKWELDTSSGRHSSTAAGVQLYTNNKKIVDEWLAQITLPKMTPAFKKAIETSLQKEFEEQVRRQVYERARDAATKALEEISDQLFSTDVVSKYFKTMNLLKED